MMNRKAKYIELVNQVKSFLDGEDDLIANLSNISSLIKTHLGFLWIGWYFVKDKQLVLGPFQGDVACTRIPFGKGVCGTSWKEKKTIIVPDVSKFTGHIACSSQSKAEIVAPVFDAKGEIMILLDIDSAKVNDFSPVDKKYIEEITHLISQKHYFFLPVFF